MADNDGDKTTIVETGGGGGDGVVAVIVLIIVVLVLLFLFRGQLGLVNRDRRAHFTPVHTQV